MSLIQHQIIFLASLFVSFYNLAIVGLHLLFLHEFGLLIHQELILGLIRYLPLLITIKDFYSFYCQSYFSVLSIFSTKYFRSPDNYIRQILHNSFSYVPEWYSLPFHAISRTIPDNYQVLWLYYLRFQFYFYYLSS